jgi:hypothetical protein
MQHQLFGDELIDYYNYPEIGNKYDMYDILVLFKIFSSKSEARKNWERTGKEIPPGYNEFKNIGKQKKALYIWNPIDISWMEDNNDSLDDNIQQCLDVTNQKHSKILKNLANN